MRSTFKSSLSLTVSLSAVEPVEHDEPTGQSEQSLGAASPSTLLYVPALQGSGAAAPWAQYEPEVQFMHAVWPYVSWNLPAGQSSQFAVPLPEEQEPGRHAVHTTGSELPGIGLAVPAGHSVHAVELLAPVTLLYVPAGHCSKV